jgi:DNA polymerase-3 subunit delta'
LELTENITYQKNAVTILTRFIESSKMPHAMLFHGPKGVGKFATAVSLLMELNRRQGLEENHLNKISSLSEPYIKYVFPLPRGKGETAKDSATSRLSPDVIDLVNSEIVIKSTNPFYSLKIAQANNIKINSIRDVRKFLSLEYGDIPVRAIIIEDAHLMNDEAQNALLKSLEEPPEGVIFVLITHKPDNLLSTIISRCQQIKFNPLSKSHLIKLLIEYFDTSRKDSELVADFADGSVEKAVELLNMDFEELVERSINVLRYSLAKRYHTALTIFSQTYEEYDSRGVELLIEIILKWFSDVQRKKVNSDISRFSSYNDTIIKFLQKFPNSDNYKIQTNLESIKNKLSLNLNLNVMILNIIFEIGHIGNKYV